MRRLLRSRRERHDADLVRLQALRAAQRLVRDDITALGEQLAGLSPAADAQASSEAEHDDLTAALAAYDAAKAASAGATSLTEVAVIDDVLVQGRFYLACVLARREGRPSPTRRDPCFFNPQHGPGSRDVDWTPPGGQGRQIPICSGCAHRLEAGEQPDHRLVRQGDRWVSWWAAGGTFDASAGIDAHVVRGSAWVSRTYRAEAEMRGAATAIATWGSGTS